MLLSPRLSQIISTELAAGEHVLWSGRPDPLTSMFSKMAPALVALPFLMISASALVAAKDRGELGGILVSLMFLGVGLFMLLMPVAAYRSARTSLFVITERRLLIVKRDGKSIQSIWLSGVRQVERVKTRNGLTLRIPTSLVSDGEGGQKVDYMELSGLRDGERAYRLLIRETV